MYWKKGGYVSCVNDFVLVSLFELQADHSDFSNCASGCTMRARFALYSLPAEQLF